MDKLINTYKSISYIWYNNKVVAYTNTVNERQNL